MFDKHDLKTFPKRLDYVKTAGQREQMLGAVQASSSTSCPRASRSCLQLCFSDPHRPLDRRPCQPHDPAKITLPAHFPDTPLVREDFARYLDEIARFDADVGTILEELQQPRPARQHPGHRHAATTAPPCSAARARSTTSACTCRFVAYWPGQTPAGTYIAAPSSPAKTCAPTMLEAAGVAVPKEMTGRSFCRCSGGKKYDDRDRTSSASAAPMAPGCRPTPPRSTWAGARSPSATSSSTTRLPQLPYHPVDFAGDPMWNELKEMHQAGKLSPQLTKLYFDPPRPMFELYDLKNDPDELKNLYGTAEVADVQTPTWRPCRNG